MIPRLTNRENWTKHTRNQRIKPFEVVAVLNLLTSFHDAQPNQLTPNHLHENHSASPGRSAAHPRGGRNRGAHARARARTRTSSAITFTFTFTTAVPRAAAPASEPVSPADSEGDEIPASILRGTPSPAEEL
ncbi:hypothetical protein CLAIMM_00156 [Cladophialophora immunda]|nr:hypothetical protein CLAIMM_00156 [Cladophialophora immunda]